MEQLIFTSVHHLYALQYGRRDIDPPRHFPLFDVKLWNFLITFKCFGLFLYPTHESMNMVYNGTVFDAHEWEDLHRRTLTRSGNAAGP